MTDRCLLAVESSCDDTSAAVLRGESELLGHIIATQDMHAEYGGVVPEVASRAQLRVIDGVVSTALAEADMTLAAIDEFAVTAGPGLIGSLLVGLNWVKGAAYARRRPLVGVHHMEAHLFATTLEDERAQPPFVALLVSGGHTLLLHVEEWGRYHLLGQTRDDAAGEAFDKVARLMGLGYPGGPAIERMARDGDATRHPFPVPMIRGDSGPDDDDYYDMSFSGLKTAVLLRVRELEESGRLEEEIPHLAAAFQQAALGQLVEKTLRAVQASGCQRVVLGGGVARNRALADGLGGRLGPKVTLFVPSPRLATDNAAMVARAARFHLDRGERADLELNARADLPMPGIVRNGASP
ncbi:MAG: tRNA (adenosine(37)-N6)-threonylcarbamoyltransferase complex transferase subunit TsaD [Gemmatimonadetes bacterium]|uniref:tRNA N6-adenosine threonylcarbamoyltransferase n=1 Tax=Candidatus Kutchimonas denitrificans TaxID=3056748 RepID=A0AAE5CC95_9BACT|nr:tRNA (adenosine(37)-N6)-threonylcarbamoyltransferase complex transferase subunit TsaD [Gemmatimonadota bacterium]NIR75528.1 tRNA (adenosine(37)-N6)-threonylcarbamoyltransferase complex transferase subunit TsaD [Candidatus Kutchimonas denitrificans]NIS01842.1 tRNA (adenosine(37)-N6)-threonylcarbamoyltransferase complex transferase subunit TsaD [Gemmatimonadota bacterium]NIT67623.1 tRNA (adenosine(37)-N6)-threonylcarbamoyltransferase complex transferase subunit TsaD [Gemmatimonadota bacterium]